MKYLNQLKSKRVFSYQDLEDIIGSNKNTISSLLQNYLKKGYIEQVRRNLYVALSMDSGTSLANRFEIGCSVAEGGYISHHTALEYYGIFSQAMYKVQVSGRKRFRPFVYDRYDYYFIPERISSGVIERENGIRVTDIERTMLDFINDLDIAGGVTEFYKCLQMLPPLDEEKLLRYLEEYNKQFLYQKAGFLLEWRKRMLHLSDSFFETCLENTMKSHRYFTLEVSRKTLEYYPKWSLYVPKNLKRIVEMTE